MTIRPARAEDWPAIVSLLSELGLPLAGAEEHRDNFLVAEASGIEAVAGLEFYGSHALLRSVAVRQGMQRSGLGRKLTEACIEAARARGVETLTLLTTTAAEYFPRFGFGRISRDEAPEAVRQSVEFQGACPASAAVLLLRLVP